MTVTIGTVLRSRTTTSQKYEAVPRRARIEGPWTCVSDKSRIESDTEEEECHTSVQPLHGRVEKRTGSDSVWTVPQYLMALEPLGMTLEPFDQLLKPCLVSTGV